MATLQYRDPADGVFKDATPYGSPGPAGAPGPTGPAATGGAGGDEVPIGSIMAWVGAAAPTGWHFCDGTAHGSAELEALFGSPNTPDLRERFIVGVGSTYALKATGGVAAVTLTAAQSGLPGHTHTATDAHVHSCNPPIASSNSQLTTHNHPMTGYLFAQTANSATKTSDAGDNNYHRITSYNTLTGAASIAHTHTVDFPAVTSGPWSPAVTIAAATAANATAAHENLPPFYALAYVIRTV